MRLFIASLLIAAAPASAQSMLQPQQPRSNIPPMRQGPTIVAEPVALAIAAFDADQDGIVTRAELTTGAARSYASVAKGAKDIGYIGYSDWALRWLGDPNALPNPFEVDTDRDDRITQAELTGALTEAFNRFDKDRDGRLTRAELITIRATMFGNDRPKPGEKKPGDKDRKDAPKPR